MGRERENGQSKGGDAGVGEFRKRRRAEWWTHWPGLDSEGSETLPCHYPFLHQSQPCLPLGLWDPQAGLTPEVPAWES